MNIVGADIDALLLAETDEAETPVGVLSHLS